MGWYSDNSGMKPQPVGLKKSNGFNLYDTHGNVWEWCWDFYDENYYSNRTTNIDPIGPKSGTRHVARGGSYADGNSSARSSNRTFNFSNKTSCGIRIVRNK
jgi:formylglycine-generating enzyme